MANQYAALDPNRKNAVLGHSDTTNDAETRRVIAVDGELYVRAFGAAIPQQYDKITITYPTGTTESYAYSLGTAAVGTVDLTYNGTAKGSLTLVEYSSP